jgi:hypothetical protein
MPKSIRVALKTTALAIVLLGGIYLGFFLHNNYGPDQIEPDEYAVSMRRATGWLLDHRKDILEDRNVMLWWMVRQAAEVSRNIDLALLVNEHRERFVKREPLSPWRRLIDDRSVSLDPTALLVADLPIYNLHFLYGLSCDRTLGEQIAVRQQMSIDYCPQQHPFAPACMTHQLMGFRFMQRFRCGEAEDINRQVTSLRRGITRQLWLDPRVVDVYLQRVLMLVEGSGTQSVRGRWIRRILDNQLEDGGWADMQPLVQLGSDHALGFARRSVAIGTMRSNLHATAQGPWLMALLDRQREDS